VTFAPLILCVIDNALLETMPHIDQPLLQFIDVVNLLDSIFLQSIGTRSVLFGGKSSGKMNAGVSFQKADCPTRSVSRNIALMEDKELATDFTHDRQ